MAFTVTEFKSNLFSNAAQGGARPSLFRVNISDSSSSFSFTSTENILVKAAAVPAATVAALPVNYPGRAYKMTGFRTYDNWTTTILNDEDFEIRNNIQDWMYRLEGDADANNDRKITNGELHNYVRSNVTRQAVRLGREQNPQLQGDENRVLVEFNCQFIVKLPV